MPFCLCRTSLSLYPIYFLKLSVSQLFNWKKVSISLYMIPCQSASTQIVLLAQVVRPPSTQRTSPIRQPSLTDRSCRIEKLEKYSRLKRAHGLRMIIVWMMKVQNYGCSVFGHRVLF